MTFMLGVLAGLGLAAFALGIVFYRTFRGNWWGF